MISSILLSFVSDNLATPLGKRFPWYIAGLFILLPRTFMFFNPPESVLDYDSESSMATNPNYEYFMIIYRAIQIGKGMIEFSHISLVNSLS